MAVGTTAFPTSLDTVVELIEAANNALTALNGSLNNSATTITVDSTSGFTASGIIAVENELISYTGITPTTFTGCVRGFESTVATTHADNTDVEQLITARSHNVLASAIIAIETKLGTGSTIAVNKLAALTASKAVVTDASGFISAATVTAAELGYLSGVTTPTGSGALVLATSPTLTTPTIAKIANLTSNGFVKTSGGDGTLSVDTSTYLTANQTITLSGDVTGSGSAAITTTIANDAVTYAKLQNVSATSRILGRKTALAGDAEECTLSEILDFIGSAAQGDILYRGAASWERLGAGTNGHFLKTQGAAANPVWAAAGSGSGDVVGPASATDNAVTRFDGTTGKLVQDSVVTIADTTGNMAGVGTLNTHTIPGGTDTFVLLTANQTLTTKTLTSPDINGGTADSLTSLSVRSTGAAFDLLFANTEVLTGNKTLTFKVNDTSRTVDLAGNLTLAAAFSTSGANALTLTTTGATNVTLPTTGTLVNSAVSSLSSLTTVGTITSGGLGTGAVIGGVTMTLGTDGTGDIYYRSAGGVLTRLAAGTNGHVLTLSSGLPAWQAAAGGGLTIGTTAITSGTVGRMLYEASGNVVGEAAGITYQTGASPTATITAQAASYVGLRINSAATPSVNIFEVSADAGTTAHFVISSTGAPSSPGAGAGSERYGLTSVAAGANSMAIGVGASSATANSMAIGRAATAGTNTFAMAIGDAASATGSVAIAIGAQSSASGASSIAIGVQAKASGASAILISTANTTYSGQYAYGFGITTGHSQGATMSLGDGALPSGLNQFVAATGAGTANIGYQEVFFGRGVTHTAPQFWRLNGVGGSGTNIAGGSLYLAGGKGTGTGLSGSVQLQTAIVGSSGTSLNTLVDRYFVNGVRKTLTDAATSLFEIALPTLKGCMGTIRYEIFAADATDVQVRSGVVRYSAVNKAGAYTSEIVVVNEGVSASTGTLTATWAIVTGTNKITIEVTPTGSLTETTYYILYTIENNSEQAITIL